MHSRRKKAVGQEGEKGFRMLPNKKLVQIHKKCYPEMEDELYTLELSSVLININLCCVTE